MHRNRRHARRVVLGLAAAALAGSVFASGAVAAETATSSCVACHTDAERLKAECASIPQPKGSALQAGKG